ncbi:hypothetical protein DICVIV_08159 [Dictyocaulus viviparus]|uniref:RNA polymerase Rpb7 protein n=1 Tax=Dictyocaulus viviparus TaxID=29172 RepID=A0A0D8XMQ6_DICVI|nr:hypothetical protein DICVIV_08159 [Dictyocaulus viviparus]
MAPLIIEKEILSFNEAKKLILTNKKCGLKVLREKRHFALPYHLIGGSVLKSCDFIARMAVGKYRQKVKGVVISVGSVRLASLPRVIDDQNVFHVKVFVTQVIFRPIVGHMYEARVTYIAEDFISALILDAISITAPNDFGIHNKSKGGVIVQSCPYASCFRYSNVSLRLLSNGTQYENTEVPYHHN